MQSEVSILGQWAALFQAATQGLRLYCPGALPFSRTLLSAMWLELACPNKMTFVLAPSNIQLKDSGNPPRKCRMRETRLDSDTRERGMHVGMS